MGSASFRRGLDALAAANAVSHMGNVVAIVALPGFVLTTTGSAARAGIVAFATTLPLALRAVAGGPVVDRLAVEMMVVPLSMLLCGFLLDGAGLSGGLLLFAAGNVLLAAYAIGNRPARRLEAAAANA